MVKLKVKKLISLSERLNGLSGKEEIYPVYLETRFGIHTFGMKVPIDVLILDGNDKIVKIGKNIKPGSLFFWHLRYYRVIETPIGLTKLKVGDKIELSK